MVRLIRESVSGGIPYDMVSMAVILRDWFGLDSDNYINREHEKLTDIADSMYNGGVEPDAFKDEYADLYAKYGKDYFDKVIDDVVALDSQVYNSNKAEELANDYNDRLPE